MKKELLVALIKYAPFTFFSVAALFIIGLYLYFKFYKKQGNINKKILNYTSWALIGFRIIYSIFLSAFQYVVWRNNPISQYLLPPHQPISSFVRYSWTNFFAEAVFSIGFAFIFYFILKAIKKHREEIFEEGELELGLACALIIGWPGSVLFVAFSFLMLLVVSALRQLLFKEQFTTITLPMLISLPIIFIFGQKLVQILHLSVLVL